MMIRGPFYFPKALPDHERLEADTKSVIPIRTTLWRRLSTLLHTYRKHLIIVLSSFCPCEIRPAFFFCVSELR